MSDEERIRAAALPIPECLRILSSKPSGFNEHKLLAAGLMGWYQTGIDSEENLDIKNRTANISYPPESR